MRVARRVQCRVKIEDRGVDPSLVTVCTAAHNLLEIIIKCHVVSLAQEPFPQAARDVKTIER